MVGRNWSWEDNYEKEKSSSWNKWLKKHWETIALNIIVWSLLVIAICAIIHLIIFIKIYWKS